MRSSSIRNGFSVVEVMMAVTILLVGFIGVIEALTIMSESLDTARKLQVAQQVVSGEIEKLRSKEWTAIASLPDSATLVISPAGSASGDFTDFALSNYTSATDDDNTTLARLAGGFTCSFNLSRLRPASATAATVTFVKLVYTVSWTSSTGRAHRYVMDTYLGRNGLNLSYRQS